MRGFRKLFFLCSAAALLLWGAFAFSAPPRFARAEGEALLSSCTTYFSEESVGRAHNIRLAAERISGIVLPPRGSFSFNAAVGERTKENGFSEAPVIERGEYVLGTGGGVCQVSGTLFHAALEAGLRIAESHPHSLPVSYLPPSLDAMVSQWSDLKLLNARTSPVTIEAFCGQGALTVRVYGTPDGLKYRAESVTLASLPLPGGEEGKEGLVSESFLCVYGEGGELISRTRVRRDRYAPRPDARESERKTAENARKSAKTRVKTVDFCICFGYNHQVTSGVPLPRPAHGGG